MERLQRLGRHLNVAATQPAAAAGALDEQVAIVTGGAGGIGAAIAHAYADAGAIVVVASRTLANLEAVAAEINARHPGRAAAIECDVTSEEQMQHLVTETVARFGRLGEGSQGGSSPQPCMHAQPLLA
jgi:7-alpha-hydroxysteroid dehydrogenase